MTFLSEPELTTRSLGWCRKLSLDAGRSVHMENPALLVLDMQNDFLTDRGAMPVWGGPAIVSRVAGAIEAFRAVGRPVLYSRHLCLGSTDKPPDLGISALIADPEGLLREGCVGSEIADRLRPSSDERVIAKYQYSAFYGTPLELLLRSLKVRHVVVTGVVTNVCCETTAHDAFFRGFGVVFTIDGTGGLDEASHLASLATIRQSYGQVVTVHQVCESVKNMRSQS